MKGLLWALCSVLLVSVSQLLLRHAMLQMPPMTQPGEVLLHIFQGGAGALPLFLGLAGYVCSMGCWFFALHSLPLSKAYALLSLSYILVWAAAQWLQNDAFSLRGLAGVALIMAGVAVIFMPSSGRSRPPV